jgi:hypothetical protein
MWYTYFEELLSFCWGKQIVVELRIPPINLGLSRRPRHCFAEYSVREVVDLRNEEQGVARLLRSASWSDH